MWADTIWREGSKHFYFGNRWGYDIWGLERCYLGVSKCFRLATTRALEVQRKKSRKSIREMFSVFESLQRSSYTWGYDVGVVGGGGGGEGEYGDLGVSKQLFMGT